MHTMQIHSAPLQHEVKILAQRNHRHTHTHTPGGATWPASQQNVPPLTMLPTFLSLACGDNAVCSVISRRVLANLSGVFNQKFNHLQMYYESVFIY